MNYVHTTTNRKEEIGLGYSKIGDTKYSETFSSEEGLLSGFYGY